MLNLGDNPIYIQCAKCGLSYDCYKTTPKQHVPYCKLKCQKRDFKVVKRLHQKLVEISERHRLLNLKIPVLL